MTTEQLITVSMATVTQIATRCARDVAAQHPNLPEHTQAEVATITTQAAIQVYCAELLAARLRQIELATYEQVGSVAAQVKKAVEALHALQRM